MYLLHLYYECMEDRERKNCRMLYVLHNCNIFCEIIIVYKNETISLWDHGCNWNRFVLMKYMHSDTDSILKSLAA